MKKYSALLAALVVSAALSPGLAQAADMKTHDMNGMQMNDADMPPAGKSADAALTEGEVRKVDKATQKITLKHGPIKNLDMPAMVMVFRAKDPVLLDQVKAGDKIRFRAEKDGAALVVTRIEPAVTP